MELHVVIEGDKDLTGQLYRQLKEAIRSGRLAAGEKLPPSRLLAERLGPVAQDRQRGLRAADV
jgi:GntR family transcriptional regulator/MocR family aminotransferase